MGTGGDRRGLGPLLGLRSSADPQPAPPSAPVSLVTPDPPTRKGAGDWAGLRTSGVWRGHSGPVRPHGVPEQARRAPLEPEVWSAFQTDMSPFKHVTHTWHHPEESPRQPTCRPGRASLPRPHQGSLWTSEPRPPPRSRSPRRDRTGSLWGRLSPRTLSVAEWDPLRPDGAETSGKTERSSQGQASPS